MSIAVFTVDLFDYSELAGDEFLGAAQRCSAEIRAHLDAQGVECKVPDDGSNVVGSVIVTDPLSADEGAPPHPRIRVALVAGIKEPDLDKARALAQSFRSSDVKVVSAEVFATPEEAHRAVDESFPKFEDAVVEVATAG